MLGHARHIASLHTCHISSTRTRLTSSIPLPPPSITFATTIPRHPRCLASLGLTALAAALASTLAGLREMLVEGVRLLAVANATLVQTTRARLARGRVLATFQVVREALV